MHCCDFDPAAAADTEGFDLRRVVQHPDQRLSIYPRVGEWLRTHTGPNATVGTLEVGMVGFYSQRPMIDFAGLIQPETALQLGPDDEL